MYASRITTQETSRLKKIVSTILKKKQLNINIFRILGYLGIIIKDAIVDQLVVDVYPLNNLKLLCIEGQSISNIIFHSEFIKNKFNL